MIALVLGSLVAACSAHPEGGGGILNSLGAVPSKSHSKSTVHYTGHLTRVDSPIITITLNVESQTFPIKVPASLPTLKLVPQAAKRPTFTVIEEKVPIVRLAPTPVAQTVKVPVYVRKFGHLGTGGIEEDGLFGNGDIGHFDYDGLGGGFGSLDYY